jgi:2Fe-2S ferredoxin
VIKINVTDQEGRKHQVEGEEGLKLMEVLREYEWGVAAVCGGMVSCGTCHVYLDEDWSDRFPPQDVDEEDLIDMLEYQRSGSRLSCQLTLEAGHDGLTLELAPDE